MASVRAKLVERAEELGVAVVDDGESVSILAPHRHVFHSGYHEHQIHLRGWTKPEAWAALLEELEHPTERCADPECEWCNDEPGLPYGVSPKDVVVPFRGGRA
jgi:hypothetical protein